MKSKYTKEERHEIYVKAKEWYIKNRRIYHPGICFSIFKQLNEIGYLAQYNYVWDLKRNFPELDKIKPAKIIHFSHYWWNLSYDKPENKDIRIKKFDKLIKMTE